MWKWMVEFIKKFENRSIKIARVNSILITKFINLQLFTLILYGVAVRCDRMRFSVLSPFIEKSMIGHFMRGKLASSDSKMASHEVNSSNKHRRFHYTIQQNITGKSVHWGY